MSNVFMVRILKPCAPAVQIRLKTYEPDTLFLNVRLRDALNNRHSSLYNAVQFNTTATYSIHNNHTAE